MRAPAPALILLAACGGEDVGPRVVGPVEPWVPPVTSFKAITHADGYPKFYSGDRLVGETRASAIVTYEYDERGLLIAERHESRTKMEVTFAYDDQDRLTTKESKSWYEDGSVFGVQRLRHEYDEAGKISDIWEEWVEEDGSWIPGIHSIYRYDDQQRLVELERDQSHRDPVMSRNVQVFDYDELGDLSEVHRIWYDENNEIVAAQTRELSWGASGLVSWSRELDFIANYEYSYSGDLKRIAVSLERRSKNPGVPRSHTFIHDPVRPATFWFAPWNVGGSPERLIDLFGRCH